MSSACTPGASARTACTHQGNPERALQSIEEFGGLGLHPGVEHEEEDPDLGQERDRLAGLDEAEDSRSHQHADDKLAHDRREPERAQGDRDQPDAGEEDQQIEGDVLHPANLAQGRSPATGTSVKSRRATVAFSGRSRRPARQLTSGGWIQWSVNICCWKS